MTTQTEANKAVVQRFFDLLSAEKYEEAFALQEPTGLVHLPSPRQSIPAADWHAVYRRLMANQFPKGVQYTIWFLTAEDDRVSAVAAGHGEMRDGADYNNHYQWLAIVRGGRIVELYESLDSVYARESIHAAGWAGREGQAAN